MLDVSVAYNRYKFLGHEFMTWLWYLIETAPEALNEADPELLALEIGNRVVLENSRHNRDETISIKGDGAGLEEGLMALKKGAKVTEMNLVFRSAEYEWRFNLKGESLNVSSLKTPQTGQIESKTDVEGVVLEKVYLFDRVLKLVEKLYCMFIKQRVSPEWDKAVVRNIQKWIDSSLEQE